MNKALVTSGSPNASTTILGQSVWQHPDLTTTHDRARDDVGSGTSKASNQAWVLLLGRWGGAMLKTTFTQWLALSGHTYLLVCTHYMAWHY